MQSFARYTDIVYMFLFCYTLHAGSGISCVMHVRKAGIMKHTHTKYAVLYNFSYMSIGAMTPLIGQYLDGKGFTGSQIGAITAAGTASAIFASMFWGRVYSASNLSTIVCQVAGGRILEMSGAWAVYLFFGAFNLDGIILYLKFRLHVRSG